MSEHKLGRDSRGYYCLGCPWPGADFVHNITAAEQHLEDPHLEVPRRLCVGCFNPMPADREPVADDHSRGCPTGANGTPNYE